MSLSTRRNTHTQTLHDEMVRARALSLQNEGYYVRADLLGFPQPPEIGGYVPDVYAMRGSTTIIAEAETCDTICAEHTKRQYRAFSNALYANFHVIVPASCLSEAQLCARQWNIRVDQWWYHEGH
jgi:hypothetical protein